jgi:putative ABC transport system substrate-binding protein
MPDPKDDPKNSEWRPYIFARDQWQCRICGDRFFYSEMVRKHIANEHNVTMPPSMYEYFQGAVWQRKTPIDYGRLRASDEAFAGGFEIQNDSSLPQANPTSFRGKLAAAGRVSPMSDMRRREFLATLGGAAAWAFAARAQQPVKIPRIGIIDDAPPWNAFRHGLRDLGYLEGQNIAFDYAYGDGVPERLAEAAAALVRRPVDVIATFGTPASLAAKQATTTIPIVMISIGDPVRAGLVPSLARPGGNITGNSVLGPDVGAKRLQILKEVIPTVSRVAFLWNPDNASNIVQFEELQRAAPRLGVMVISVSVGPHIEFETAFAAMMKERPDAFAMTGEPFHQTHIAWIIEFMAKNRLQAMYQLSENVRTGGLMSYGASEPDLFRRAAGYVHKILQGTKPADLPVEQPVKFELAVNLKTAKALGLTLPPGILALADEVIE